MKIFSGHKSIYFAESVAYSLGVKLGKSEKKTFSDGEFTHILNETVRGEKVFIIQSTFQPSDNLIELVFMIDAAKRGGASEIIAVVPYMGFSRGDKKDFPRSHISASVVMQMIQNVGATQIITMDLHADQLQAFVQIPVSHIYSSAVFIPYLKKYKDSFENVIISSPDVGGAKRAKSYSQKLGTDMVICYKHRSEANKIDEMIVIGDVKNKHVIIVDDIADTCGTISKASSVLLEKGALSVSALITHPVLSGNAYEKIKESSLESLITTDSIPSIASEKIKIISVANLFADVIKSINENKSISDNFLK